MKETILAINPGSTSTKIAVYVDGENLFTEALRHTADELAGFKRLAEQKGYRISMILDRLAEAGVDPASLTCVVSRAGGLDQIPGGVYEINDTMIAESFGNPKEHASNLGPAMAREIAAMSGAPAYIVDPTSVDELWPPARITGLAGVTRITRFHALNQRAVARMAAATLSRRYEDLNVIVCHAGGGISVGVHRHGVIVDVNNSMDGDGPMSPDRSGSIPNVNVLNLAYSGLTYEEAYKTLVGKAGLYGHFGTTDAREIEKRIVEGDEKAELVYRTMAYQIAKEIGALATTVQGEVDIIALTGGLMYSDLLRKWVTDSVSWIAPVYVYPGEREMEALFEGASRVLHGEEKAKKYKE